MTTTVAIKVFRCDLSERMTAMREWLDKHRYEPSQFSSTQYQNYSVVCLDFNKEAEAEAFRQHFARGEISRGALALPNGLNGIAGSARETMEQVCWWRLMAEEVRTEADGLGSDAATEAMGQVASSYDQMAESLERRLSASSEAWVWSMLGNRS
jgi:hypothetical protein